MVEETADLFEQTLAGDYDDEAPWAAVDALRTIGSQEIFDIAAQWTRSADPRQRARGADVLAQLGVGPGRPHAFPQESCDILLRLLQRETCSRPVASAIVGLGHIRELRSLPAIVDFATHHDAEVRHAVAFALGSFVEHASSLACLMRLMTDPDPDVRDWATFALGVLGDADTPEIRDALAQRLNDPFEPARKEAIAGLAKRKDERARPFLPAFDAVRLDAGRRVVDEAVPRPRRRRRTLGSRDVGGPLRTRSGDQMACKR